MSKFKLKEVTLTIRDMEVRVRELTQKERNDFVHRAADDRFRGPAILASLGCVDPQMTEEEWADEPSEVVEAVVSQVMELSGMKKKEGDPEKEPDARRAH